MDSDTTDVVNAVIFVIFTALLLIGAASTLLRGLRYRRAHISLPVLWVRDRDLVGGLAIPFVLILGARALDVEGVTSTQLWWTLLTATPALYGVARYVYFELFVIERPKRLRLLDRPETAIELEDRTVGDERRRLQQLAKEDE